MASTHVHVPPHVSAYQELPPSPTLTNPDMILPFDEQHEAFPTLVQRSTSPPIQADLVSNSSFDGRQRSDSESNAEVGIATAVTLPMLVRGPVATTIAVPATIAYQHGAPLSDIGEEVEEIILRSSGSSPDESKTSPRQGHPLRHKKGLSDLSSSSGGSDTNEQWDRFDTSHLMSDRVAADIAQARNAAEENEDSVSKRGSKDIDEELAVLNDRAEKILANARKRLSSMEDNLTKARHSILLSPRSIPNMHELGHQPAGGLYRSISQNAHNRRSKGLFPSLKVMGLQHARTGSEMVPATGLKRLSGIPEPRSASAMDFSPARYGVGFITSELKPSPPSKMMSHSPSSSRSYNSPLRILPKEAEANTPSTVKTSPDESTSGRVSFSQGRGLGIHSSGTKEQEDLTQIAYESSESPTSLNRSSSQASTRSARELRDQISEMKNRITDLKHKAQADSLRRQSSQSLRTPSPFLNSNINGHGAEGWYRGTAQLNEPQQSTTPAGQPTITSRSSPRRNHERRDSALESITDQPPAPAQVVRDVTGPEMQQIPVTPLGARLLHANDGTPVHPSSARTDRNTPNLVSRTADVYQSSHQDYRIQQNPVYDMEELELEISEDDDEPIAANQEEQIYLNEVLEESLHDLEPEVPSVPGEYLVGDELMEVEAEETERHEDRLDAFDYENMFLHSAMGTYLGNNQSDDSDNESLITSREDVRTPTGALEYEDRDDGEDTISGEDPSIGDYSVQGTGKPDAFDQRSSPSSSRGPPTPVQRQGSSPVSPSGHRRTPLRENVNTRLRSPTKPWTGVARTKSMETISSTASYQTAIEGEDDEQEDEDYHDEILNWGNAPSHQPNSQSQYLPAQGVSAKAQNVLGWPTPPITTGATRHLSYIHPQQVTVPGTHTRSASSNSGRNMAGRSPLSNVQYNAYPFPTPGPVQPPPNQPLPPPPPQAQTQQAAVSHQANTEILMESLIKLADPEFSIESTGRSNFADIDKELVLGLLRAVGGVCDGVLRAQHSRRANVVKDLRSRLVNAKDVLIGIAEPEGLEEILEDDEDAE